MSVSKAKARRAGGLEAAVRWARLWMTVSIGKLFQRRMRAPRPKVGAEKLRPRATELTR